MTISATIGSPALHFDNPEDPQSVQMLDLIKSRGLDDAVSEITGINAGDPMVAEIVNAYKEVERI